MRGHLLVQSVCLFGKCGRLPDQLHGQLRMRHRRLLQRHKHLRSAADQQFDVHERIPMHQWQLRRRLLLRQHPVHRNDQHVLDGSLHLRWRRGMQRLNTVLRRDGVRAVHPEQPMHGVRWLHSSSVHLWVVPELHQLPAPRWVHPRAMHRYDLQQHDGMYRLVSVPGNHVLCSRRSGLLGRVRLL
jgi:hypothetical protein